MKDKIVYHLTSEAVQRVAEEQFGRKLTMEKIEKIKYENYWRIISKMEKTFVVSFKLRYAETSDWGTEYLKARNKEQALSRFAKTRKISTRKFKSVDEWEWEEGVWSAQFWNIKQVEETPCPHCSGTGIINI